MGDIICAETTLSGASEWSHGVCAHDAAPSPSESYTYEEPAPPPPSSSPPTATTTPPILSRCSSTSSLASIYSSCSNESSSTTDSSSPDESFPIIGILKKPKPLRRRRCGSADSGESNGSGSNSGSCSSNRQQQKQQRWDGSLSQRSCDDDNSDRRNFRGFREGHHHSNSEKHLIMCTHVENKEDHNNNNNSLEGDGEEEKYYWDDQVDNDDISECDIVFDRHVSFSDPIATDLVSGCPVLPSPHSRAEWTAKKARERLEMEMKKFMMGEVGEEDVWKDRLKRMKRKEKRRVYSPPTRWRVWRGRETGGERERERLGLRMQ